jgi:hypothetical protein
MHSHDNKVIWVTLMGGMVSGALMAFFATAYHFNEEAKVTKTETVTELRQATTDAFIAGACGGVLQGCNTTVEVAGSPLSVDGTTVSMRRSNYKIVLGRAYLVNDPTSSDKPEPVLLPKSCHTAGDDSPAEDQSGQCKVVPLVANEVTTTLP